MTDISPEAVERLARTAEFGMHHVAAATLRAQATRIAELEAENAILRTEKHADAEAIGAPNRHAYKVGFAAGRIDALRESAERIDRKIRNIQPEMTRRAQRLAAGKKPGFQYAIHRADLDARISDRDMILALKTETPT